MNTTIEIEKVAVLGATGFLGFKVSQLLLENGYSIVMGVPERLSQDDENLIKSLFDKYGQDKVRVSEFCFLTPKRSEELLFDCQALVHCARSRQRYFLLEAMSIL